MTDHDNTGPTRLQDRVDWDEVRELTARDMAEAEAALRLERAEQEECHAQEEEFDVGNVVGPRDYNTERGIINRYLGNQGVLDPTHPLIDAQFIERQEVSVKNPLEHYAPARIAIEPGEEGYFLVLEDFEGNDVAVEMSPADLIRIAHWLMDQAIGYGALREMD